MIQYRSWFILRSIVQQKAIGHFGPINKDEAMELPRRLAHAPHYPLTLLGFAVAFPVAKLSPRRGLPEDDGEGRALNRRRMHR